ncbi:MAG: M28 family metallopeptidase [Actinomycetota bacterium]
MRKALALGALAVFTACTGAPVATPSSSPSASTASPSPSSSPLPSIKATATVEEGFTDINAYMTIREIVTRAPYRVAGSTAYGVAGAIVEARFRALGYHVYRQPFSVPAGKVNLIPEPAGTTFNVVAEPPGFDPAKPHIVVGGHLDSVPNTPGANDDASGPAVILELARLARIVPTRMPVVFVAFSAEERRRQSPSQSEYALGSKAYIADMSRVRARALKGMINVDMVGAGPDVQVIGTSGSLVATVYTIARRLHVPAETHGTISQGFSDHISFQAAGYAAAWLWAGDNPTLHTPRDTMAVIQPAELERIGRVAWETIRTLSI